MENKTELEEDQMEKITAGMPKEELEALKNYIKSLPKAENELNEDELEQVKGGVPRSR